MKGRINYYNLSACSGHRMMYLRSTDIEGMNWESLLLSFPDEALYFMSQGKTIIITDHSTKKKGKIERVFVPAFLDFLRRINGQDIKDPIVLAHTNKAYEAYRLSKVVQRKYNFWRHRIRQPNVIGVTVQKEKEISVLGERK